MAETDPALLHILKNVANETILYFSKATWLWDEKPVQGYVGVGEYGLQFFTRSFTKKHTACFISYSVIDSVSVYNGTSDQLFCFKKRHGEHWFWQEERAWGWIDDGYSLLKHLELAYLAYQASDVGVLCDLKVLRPTDVPRLVRDSFRSQLEPIVTLKGWSKWRRVSQSGFDYFVPSHWVATRFDRFSGSFEDPSRGLSVWVEVQVPSYSGQGGDTGEGSQGSFLDLVQDVLEMMSYSYPRLIVEQNRNVIKRMNLSNDSAAWRMRELIGVHDDGGVCCYVLRRSLCPPLRETVQDIVIQANIDLSIVGRRKRGGDEDEEEEEEEWDDDDGPDPAAIMVDVRAVADSLTPARGLTGTYDDLIECKCDTLLYPPAALDWLGTQAKVRPAVLDALVPVLRVLILELFRKTHVPVPKDLETKLAMKPRDQLEYDVQGYDVAQQLRYLMERLVYSPAATSALYFGIDTLNDRHAELIHLHMFRIAQYLGRLLSGSLAGEELQVGDLLATVDNADDFDLQILSELLLFIVHARSADFTQPFDPKTSWTDLLNILFTTNVEAGGGETQWTTKQVWEAIQTYAPEKKTVPVAAINRHVINAHFLAMLLNRHTFDKLARLIQAGSEGATAERTLAPFDLCLKLQCLVLSSSAADLRSKAEILTNLVTLVTLADDLEADQLQVVHQYAAPAAVTMLMYCTQHPVSTPLALAPTKVPSNFPSHVSHRPM
ncbi:hypothetical protein GNI_030980 [Gregarina niphandrodes]|uniref:Uncharacterized protein n=1 Tax=Gregarina niphandrodes TaxID=110365 RepID=A0A023BBA7_GRENI|nr:hypothetical protein GNI_030980 [Gregarina niphandrodes]EZG78952.1 hypothetical protein GNI_030980 [Gregarina niphandrodes]|eukprot:XP_011129159.1 hypothetical protein GNI_030980 [Gregarina niphandrodes]